MFRKVVLGLMLALLLTGMFTFRFFIHPANAVTIVVPDDYPTIQEAIDEASEGDTIFVRHGNYSEHLVLNKSVSLVGEDSRTTFLHFYNNTGVRVYSRARAVLDLFEGEISITKKGTEKVLKIEKMTNQKYSKNELVLQEEKMQE